jgi:hypothetical protein
VRGDPRQADPVGGDARADAFRVSEQDLPWDELCHALMPTMATGLT